MEEVDEKNDLVAFTLYFPDGKKEETRALTNDEVERLREAIPEIQEKKKVTIFVYD